MLLAEDLNIKVVAFADGEDPDSYAQKVQPGELKEFLNENANDFVAFKSSLLLNEAGDDPVKLSELIQDIVESISKIPDTIKACFIFKNYCRQIGYSRRNATVRVK